ncbi:MAG: 3-deoxy-D-manno-octulosonic acid transferase [Bacteroidota bacterium]
MILYSIGIAVYQILVRLFSLWNRKAKKMIEGRANIFSELEVFKSKNSNTKIIWFHAASLGEFEQGRPLIEVIKNQYQDYKILLSFFSPSGYEMRKNYPFADHICYLPFDTKKNAEKFVSILNPDVVVFIKYEFWLRLINELKKKNIPVYLISAVFHKNQPFFKWYGTIFRSSLPNYEKIFLQDDSSAKLLSNLNLKNFSVTGDSRFDRVIEIAQEKFSDEKIRAFCENKSLIIGGSTYDEEENMLAEFFVKNKSKFPEIRLIIAPHELNESSINRIEKTLKKNNLSYIRYTENKISNTDVIILDTMGMLSGVYRFGSIAVIGGGFNDGIHSTIEASVYGLPVLFGPNHLKFKEAKEMIELGAAFSFENSNQLNLHLNQLLFDKSCYQNASLSAANYIKENSGATKKILGEMKLIL